jgi:6-pyruvoyl-tetrahydropterin synthase
VSEVLISDRTLEPKKNITDFSDLCYDVGYTTSSISQKFLFWVEENFKVSSSINVKPPSCCKAIFKSL